MESVTKKKLKNTRPQSNISNLKIAKIWPAPPGTTEKYHFDEPLFLGKEIKIIGNFEADLLIIKLKEELSVIITNTELTVEQHCSHCLKQFEYKIEIPSMEREFFMEIPPEIGDPFDIFLINRNDMTIDLTEMLRQEIILHFPFIPVCSEHCKGLCKSCGKNLNEKGKHTCSEPSKNDAPEQEGTYKPFANLKDLMK